MHLTAERFGFLDMKIGIFSMRESKPMYWHHSRDLTRHFCSLRIFTSHNELPPCWSTWVADMLLTKKLTQCCMNGWSQSMRVAASATYLPSASSGVNESEKTSTVPHLVPTKTRDSLAAVSSTLIDSTPNSVRNMAATCGRITVANIPQER